MLKQLGDALPEGVAVRPMGEQRLKDIERPEPLHELMISGISASPPAERSEASASEDDDDLDAFEERMEKAIQRQVLREIERSFQDPKR